MDNFRRVMIIGGFVVLCTLFFDKVGAQSKSAEIGKAYADISSKIKNSHPRVFIDETIVGEVKRRATESANREHFQKTKSRIDKLMKQNMVVVNPDTADGSQSKSHAYGYAASEAALLYLVTEDKTYLDFTKKALEHLVEYYTASNAQNRNVHWFAYSRISALAAFDWVYNDLTESERIKIGKPLLNAMNTMVFLDGRKRMHRENRGNYRSGYYGNPALAWYAGLVFYQTGIHDQLAEKLLKQGFEDHWKLLRYRKDAGGSDGGASTAVMEYAIQAYPWAEFNFFHSVRSATGMDISEQWTSPLDLLYYTVWNWLPGNRHVGYGDADHITNKLPLRQMYAHLMQMNHFYGERHPEVQPLMDWILGKVQRYSSDSMPLLRYIVDYYPTIPKKAKEELLGLPSAMHFENMGQIFMRSGSGPNDTYASFSAGGMISQHRHYDNNHFVIYRNGFRALDSGTRPQPGQHLSHYYSRTVAHNCILIRMPEEEFPRYWGSPAISETPLPTPNDGGQRKIIGSTVVGYSQGEQYVYIASDATDAYHKDKAQTVLRQFIFVQPDIFVVYDKIVSKSADYPKTWLLHTAAEPVFVKNNEFYETSQGGTLFCRTVFPADAKATKIGGAGKQFWSDGRNWPLPELTPEDWNYQGNRHRNYRDTTALFGQWRVEVSPGSSNLKDSFLHLIQVGDEKLKDMISSKAIERGNKKGVEFDYLGKTYQVLFSDDESVGGNIRITKNGSTVLDEAFSSTVEHQESIFKTK